MVSAVGSESMRGVAFVLIGLGMIDWTLSHFLQDTIALLTICCCVRVLDSKISWFLLNQRPQQIQGKMLEVIPTGGRVTRRAEVWSSSLKETLWVESKVDVQGVSSQTLIANGQRKSKWVRVSWSPQRGQLVFLLMPLRRRLSHVGKQSLAHFQRKCFKFWEQGWRPNILLPIPWFSIQKCSCRLDSRDLCSMIARPCWIDTIFCLCPDSGIRGACEAGA